MASLEVLAVAGVAVVEEQGEGAHAAVQVGDLGHGRHYDLAVLIKRNKFRAGQRAGTGQPEETRR